MENGTNTLATIPKILRTAPSLDSYNKISISCLTQTLQSYGIYLTKEESSALFSFLDKTNPKKISINDFLIAIRGKPNEERQACIDFVFNKFDKTRSGYAEASELRKVFNCIKHPRFLTGELNEDQIFYLYLKNFFDEPRSSLSKLVKLNKQNSHLLKLLSTTKNIKF